LSPYKQETPLQAGVSSKELASGLVNDQQKSGRGTINNNGRRLQPATAKPPLIKSLSLLGASQGWLGQLITPLTLTLSPMGGEGKSKTDPSFKKQEVFSVFKPVVPQKPRWTRLP